MEGVYVYHWYRADATQSARPIHEFASEGVNGQSGASHENGDIDPPAWNRVPVTGHRILLIGHDTPTAVEHLKARNPASLDVVETDDGDGVEFADGSFDAIIACDLLERLPRPAQTLHKLRRWLACDGRLITRFQTVRSLPVVEELLAGRWLKNTRPSGARQAIRYYTRREVEKLLYRAGFTVDLLESLPGRGHAEWAARGSPGRIRVGRLNIDGLPTAEAEEFYSHGFLVEAVAFPTLNVGLTSIIIVTFNQLEYTRQCVESIRLMTDEPYELIFVDNASTDGTVDYLKSLAGATVIENAENRGFPAAVNQGIIAATGRSILLLNNDTIVTTGWLRRLLVALDSDPKIGLAGPCSNLVGSEQQVDVNYESLTGLDAFAWEWGRAQNRKPVDTHRLIGFCLLIRREVVDAVGFLDERFGVGCFEDDDYCLRAIEAGWRAVIAQDAFIHHFGGRTFVGSGLDHGAILRENGRRFREKWAPNVPPGESLTPALPAPAERRISFTLEEAPDGGLLLHGDQVRISLCMIVRDSGRTLRPCLESIRPWVDEMVIVDTGQPTRRRKSSRSWADGCSIFPGVTTFQPHAMNRCGTRGVTGSSGWIRTTLSPRSAGGSFAPWSTPRSIRVCWSTSCRFIVPAAERMATPRPT
jgi:GT2 family glycosyltransferase